MAASGRKWPQVAASGRKWPLPASGRKWPQVAASGRSQRVAASGRKWPLPASGRKWPQVAASGRFTDNGLLQPIAVNPCGHSQPLAATRSHSSGCKWPQVAAPDKSERVAASGRFRPNQFPPSKQPPCNFLYTVIYTCCIIFSDASFGWRLSTIQEAQEMQCWGVAMG